MGFMLGTKSVYRQFDKGKSDGTWFRAWPGLLCVYELSLTAAPFFFFLSR